MRQRQPAKRQPHHSQSGQSRKKKQIYKPKWPPRQKPRGNPRRPGKITPPHPLPSPVFGVFVQMVPCAASRRRSASTGRSVRNGTMQTLHGRLHAAQTEKQEPQQTVSRNAGLQGGRQNCTPQCTARKSAKKVGTKVGTKTRKNQSWHPVGTSGSGKEHWRKAMIYKGFCWIRRGGLWVARRL